MILDEADGKTAYKKLKRAQQEFYDTDNASSSGQNESGEAYLAALDEYLSLLRGEHPVAPGSDLSPGQAAPDEDVAGIREDANEQIEWVEDEQLRVRELLGKIE